MTSPCGLGNKLLQNVQNSLYKFAIDFAIFQMAKSNCNYLLILLNKKNPDSKEHQLYLFISELQYCSAPSNKFLKEKIVPEGTFTWK